MDAFKKEFRTLSNYIDSSERVLLYAHKRPDPDTVGSTVAMKLYLTNIGKTVDIACVDRFPDFLQPIMMDEFLHPDDVDVSSYDLLIGCDSVERGFTELLHRKSDFQLSVFIDHHLDTKDEADLMLIDPEYSSTCEILYNYFMSANVRINRQIATALLVGILGDTGNLQHANTTPEVISIAESLMRFGADPARITDGAFSNKDVKTLHLWGRAIEKARFSKDNGMIVTVLTKKDLDECQVTSEDLKQVASILITVPETRFSLFLFQLSDGIIKASLRSEEDRGVNVAHIAQEFGGGGHKLAGGFEMPGTLVEIPGGWKVV